MNWKLKENPQIPAGLKSASLSQITLRLLLQRGFFSKEKIEKFLMARYEDLHSPDDLSGVSEAVARIGKAKDRKESVTVFGDYDADGITSTVLLKESLEEIGISPSTYIPDRNKEGYGINKEAIDFLEKEYKTKLLITVDCGISNREEIKYCSRKGMEVIVVDHHSLPKKLPEKSILINPKLPNQEYPFKDLAGVGVAFKLCQALWKKFIPKKIGQLKWLLDLVAIGTVADCVPLVDENRIFTKFGLVVLQKTKRTGVQEIIKTARLNISEASPPSAKNIAFQIGPRLNAAGRMDHADLTLNLLLEKDVVKARVAALELEAKNSERQKMTQEIFAEVKSTLEDNEKYKLIIRKGKNWPLGILGVVAGKVAEEYHCPTFILRENNEILEGSGRSIDVFNLIEAVSSLSGQLEKYGGHSQAMGIKIKPKNLPQFEKNLLKIIEKGYDENTWGKRIQIDAEIRPQEIDWDILSEIRKFEPFGEGNREPVFLTKGLFVLGIRQVGNGQKHLKFVFGSDNSGKRSFEGIFFKGGDFFSKFRSGDRVAVVYNLRSNEWSGNRKIELDIIDLKKDK
ncbi:MAG: single-stranded-DNA-specific exonuclease RecJ [Candidatus Moranbacteria bacterium RIFOXYB1_FULL_43_19]|nr:MAG: single-stranded-DNA-specific exonuclease RecJ [Candidatus Moranbacteria bacterium RIFOXYA1_FULL_44_7]OGI27321.1 MAG: single-stranded-DNA-specific exonuclease RecJ [Candidatus Moranbacteria bacterium RIFOXYB1_FULL_43_19]OGI33825.1 MAG: single-stranded-DNA-specific exonuclease RecJ [Candidatus Moranbacteria bacterium RIFOXYC1_FULL_44_13]OGI38773.1 MAG: single-stranded-DNA-specific exonuclease RecJ [Candidatus Moranbacteria bacterium RIFOXYD1_FULL_44_12]